jgi:hypothetical protein
MILHINVPTTLENRTNCVIFVSDQGIIIMPENIDLRLENVHHMLTAAPMDG